MPSTTTTPLPPIIPKLIIGYHKLSPPDPLVRRFRSRAPNRSHDHERPHASKPWGKVILKMFAASIRWGVSTCRGGYVEVLLSKKTVEVWKNCLPAVVDVWKFMTQER